MLPGSRSTTFASYTPAPPLPPGMRPGFCLFDARPVSLAGRNGATFPSAGLLFSLMTGPSSLPGQCVAVAGARFAPLTWPCGSRWCRAGDSPLPPVSDLPARVRRGENSPGGTSPLPTREVVASSPVSSGHSRLRVDPHPRRLQAPNPQCSGRPDRNAGAHDPCTRKST